MTRQGGRAFDTGMHVLHLVLSSDGLNNCRKKKTYIYYTKALRADGPWS